MIKKLEWDSNFFKRKIGEIKLASTASNPSGKIDKIVKKAKEDGYEYIMHKIKFPQTSLIRGLESAGFYLSDIGVTWEVEACKFSYENITEDALIRNSVKVATGKDVQLLRKMAKSLFLESRFYTDPFFTKKDADNLFQAWIENSVKGKVADIVLFIPYVGFVTCKKSEGKSGKILLIGVTKENRNKNIGRILVTEAIKWLNKENVILVSVRTQLKNVSAMNFYCRAGFHVKDYDMIFANIL